MKPYPDRLPYQDQLIARLVKEPRVFVMVRMGLRKTATTLAALWQLYEEFMIYKVLIVAPLRVAKYVWPEEIEKWKFPFTYSLVFGTAEQRLEALKKDVQLYIISSSNICWLVRQAKARSIWPFDCLIVDESSQYKSAQSLRWQALASVVDKTDRIYLLTGTPAPNDSRDLWSQVYLLDEGKRLSSQTNFLKEYFEFIPQIGRRLEKKDAAEKIREKIKDLCFCLASNNVDGLELPEKTEVNINIDLPDKAWEKIHKLDREFALPEEGITAANAAVLQGKLIQMSSGAIYKTLEDKRSPKIWVEFHTAKLDTLQEIIDDAGENIIVFYSFQHELERLKRRFPWIRDLREKGAMEAWNRGEISLLAAHPKSCGYGLNLQDGGHMAVWFSLTWSSEEYDQSNARLWRSGQKNMVRIFRLIAKGTIDEYVLDVLIGKKTAQQALMDYFEENNRYECVDF